MYANSEVSAFLVRAKSHFLARGKAALAVQLHYVSRLALTIEPTFHPTYAPDNMISKFYRKAGIIWPVVLNPSIQRIARYLLRFKLIYNLNFHIHNFFFNSNLEYSIRISNHGSKTWSSSIFLLRRGRKTRHCNSSSSSSKRRSSKRSGCLNALFVEIYTRLPPSFHQERRKISLSLGKRDVHGFFYALSIAITARTRPFKKFTLIGPFGLSIVDPPSDNSIRHTTDLT